MKDATTKTSHPDSGWGYTVSALRAPSKSGRLPAPGWGLHVALRSSGRVALTPLKTKG